MTRKKVNLLKSISQFNEVNRQLLFYYFIIIIFWYFGKNGLIAENDLWKLVHWKKYSLGNANWAICPTIQILHLILLQNWSNTQ